MCRDQVTGLEITVTLVEMQPGKVRLGFDAPRQIEIYRTEVDPQQTEREAS